MNPTRCNAWQNGRRFDPRQKCLLCTASLGMLRARDSNIYLQTLIKYHVGVTEDSHRGRIVLNNLLAGMKQMNWTLLVMTCIVGAVVNKMLTLSNASSGKALRFALKRIKIMDLMAIRRTRHNPYAINLAIAKSQAYKIIFFASIPISIAIAYYFQVMTNKTAPTLTILLSCSPTMAFETLWLIQSSFVDTLIKRAPQRR